MAGRHAFLDDTQRLVGMKCSESGWSEGDLSNASFQTAQQLLQSSLKRAELGAEANLFRRIDMAPEIFVVYLQSAIGPQDEPCLPILTMAKEPQIGVSSNVQVGLAG